MADVMLMMKVVGRTIGGAEALRQGHGTTAVTIGVTMAATLRETIVALIREAEVQAVQGVSGTTCLRRTPPIGASTIVGVFRGRTLRNPNEARLHLSVPQGLLRLQLGQELLQSQGMKARFQQINAT